jgi:predicted nucleic acid-binding protein
MASYYVDACIYLNWWKQESGALFREPFWKSAKKFFENVDKNQDTIYYSGFLLKELSYKLTESEFIKKLEFIESSPNFLKINLNGDEYEMAQKIKRDIDFEISFFDVIHLILAKKTNSTLVTRDKKLLKIARKFRVMAKKPEKIIL